MRLALVFCFLVSLAGLTTALPSGQGAGQASFGSPSDDLRAHSPASPSSYRSVVIWHGLGDWYSSEGMSELIGDLQQRYPGIFVHSIRIEDDASRDRKAGFFGNINAQIAVVADQLKAIPELKAGYDAIGFSQGGQFLRALIELHSAPVKNLITFGSQHCGVSDLPACAPNDLLCKVARSAAFRGVYSPYAQSNLVQAQYFRDQDRLDLYLRTNTFLALINNELKDKDASYKHNLVGLSKLVLLRFRQEETVSPPISSHFGSLQPLSDSALDIAVGFLPPKREEIRVRDSQLYKEDWIGLRELDERGAIEFGWCDGAHMQISLGKGGCWDEAVSKWIGTLV